MAEASGVKAIVATPHFPGDAASFRRLGAMLGRFERLEQAVRQEGLKVKLFPGAEILCLPETPRLAAQKVLPTLGDSDYLLVEFNFGESAAYMDEMLESLVQAGYRPVVAHPERYRAVQGNQQRPSSIIRKRSAAAAITSILLWIWMFRMPWMPFMKT